MKKHRVANVDYFVELSSATLYARALPLAESLSDYGINCRVIRPINWSSIAGGKLSEILSIFLLHNIKDYLITLHKRPDVVIIGRSASVNIYFFLKLLKYRGIKIIYDLDDAVILPSLSFLGKKIRSPAYLFAEKMVKHSDAVIVNGNYLYSYTRSLRSEVFIIHVPVDTNLFNPKRRKHSRKITIGWQGNPANHHENIRILINPLERLAQEFDFRFKLSSFMGDNTIKRMFENLQRLIEIDFGPDHWLSLKHFAERMFDFDILVAPLAISDWNQGKSALRVSMGMALGIPVVASPFGEQKFVIRHGENGFFARSEEDWYRYLKSLIENEKLRAELGNRARQTSESDLSLQSSGKKLSMIIRSLE
jgi:glycosyltransferase involved in cell wall biosynthesis